MSTSKLRIALSIWLVLIVPVCGICQSASICLPPSIVDSLIQQSQYADFAREQLRAADEQLALRDRTLTAQYSVLRIYQLQDSTQRQLLRIGDIQIAATVGQLTVSQQKLRTRTRQRNGLVLTSLALLAAFFLSR